MNTVENNAVARQQLIGATVEAYMDLYVMMQFSATSHWLMLELTFAQARALIILAAHRSLTISQLAKILGVGNPTASILVKQLVERGLVTRTENESDRRQIVITLSEKGAEIGAGRRSERARQLQRWLSHLNDEELNALARGLTAFKEVMQADTGYLNQQTALSEIAGKRS